MDNDSKKSIKDAREAVKNKDFEKALELCKVRFRWLMICSTCLSRVTLVIIADCIEE